MCVYGGESLERLMWISLFTTPILTVLGNDYTPLYLCVCIQDYFRTLFHVIFSDQPERREKERAAYIYFMDYVEDCEGI